MTEDDGRLRGERDIEASLGVHDNVSTILHFKRSIFLVTL